jgi:hypothetical protein
VGRDRAHARRKLEWNNGSVHRYEWNHAKVNPRCPRCGSPDNDLYMVTDDLWASSGLGSYECFRCLEDVIGRQLVPVDFKRGLPANDGHHHGPELRRRIGGWASAVNEAKDSVAEENTADAGAYVQHVAPIWRNRMDFVFDAFLPEDCAPKRFEQLAGRQVADAEFELCCIPFFLYDVSLGDVVATTADYVLDRVVRPSGRYTFRVYFGDGADPKEGPKDQIAAELELQLGALLEWHGANLLAVDSSDGELAQTIADYLQARERAGQLIFETGRTRR